MKRTFQKSCLFWITLLMTSQAFAIVIRHDRDEATYLEAAKPFAAVGLIQPNSGVGTLITPEWVITAAYVAKKTPEKAEIHFENKSYSVEKVVIHPEWKETDAHDVALLRLSHPVKGIEPISIYSGSAEAGMIAILVGYGDAGTGLTGPQTGTPGKRAATNKVEATGKDWLFFIFDEPSNATELEGIGGTGDEGSPAIIEVKGKLFVAGVSSWSDSGTNRARTYGTKEGYTRVSSDYSWIVSTILGVESKTE
jgi:hypothetical protein